MRSFKKLEIWKNGIAIVEHIYVLTQHLPDDEKFGLKSQLTRAAVSVPSNNAGGSSRNSEKEFKRFLEIALGSLFKVENQLIIAEKLKFLNAENLGLIFKLIEKESKMINSLISKIKDS